MRRRASGSEGLRPCHRPGIYRQPLNTGAHKDRHVRRGRGFSTARGEIGKLSEFFATKMRDQFLFCKEENAILLFINPDRKRGFFRRFGD